MSPTTKLALLGQSPACTSCGHTHSHTHSTTAVQTPRRTTATSAVPRPSPVTDRQLEVVMQQLRAHSIDVDPGGRFAYRRRRDGAYEKITLRDAILIATGRRKVAS